ncbi:energy transducer TonB [Hymenobacter gummosus]|nr:energy transducer TonB [Hymenobacter gummosus]
MPLLLLLGMCCCVPLTLRAQGHVRQTDLDSGRVEKGRRLGVWSFYALTASGRKVLIQRYYFDRKKLLYYRKLESQPYRHQVGSDWLNGPLDRPPMYLGGDALLATYIRQLEYPEQARTNNVQGRVIVRFVVDTLGQASEYQVLQGIGSGCDEEALRVARNIPHEWIPGRKGGRAVKVQYELPFTFRLAERPASGF